MQEPPLWDTGGDPKTIVETSEPLPLKPRHLLNTIWEVLALFQFTSQTWESFLSMKPESQPAKRVEKSHFQALLASAILQEM